jgi:hypothetical protein
MSQKPELDVATFTFYQDDENGGDVQTLKVKTDDAGGGKYFVIETERWSIDNEADLLAMLARVRAAFTNEEWGG